MLCQEAAEGIVLGSVLFHVYMHDPKLAVKCLPVKFTEDPKLGIPVGHRPHPLSLATMKLGAGWEWRRGSQGPSPSQVADLSVLCCNC